MVISFIQMGSKLFHTGQPYRAKEGRIIRILQGTGRISINLIEYEVSAHQIIIIPDNSLIELLEISPDYDSSHSARLQFSACPARFYPVGNLHEKRYRTVT